jgi:hypothetical protein
MNDQVHEIPEDRSSSENPNSLEGVRLLEGWVAAEALLQQDLLQLVRDAALDPGRRLVAHLAEDVRNGPAADGNERGNVVRRNLT